MAEHQVFVRVDRQVVGGQVFLTFSFSLDDDPNDWVVVASVRATLLEGKAGAVGKMVKLITELVVEEMSAMAAKVGMPAFVAGDVQEMKPERN